MAFMAKRMYQGQLTATLTTTLATVTSSTTWIVTDIQICNTDTAARTVTLRMPGSAAGAEIFSALAIPASTTVSWSGHIVLSSAETITGGADSASKVTVTISGTQG